MMDYFGFWDGIIVVFGVVPVVVGAGLGAIWAWRDGRRGKGIIAPTVLDGAMFDICVFAGVIFVFRA
jgi:hypothetical protein